MIYVYVDFEPPDWRMNIIFHSLIFKTVEKCSMKICSGRFIRDWSRCPDRTNTRSISGPSAAIWWPLLKCSPDFIWILVPCLNPGLILTHFFVLHLDEREHCRRANRHVDDRRECGRRAIFTHQRHISSEWRDEDTRQRLLEQNDAETVWQIQVKKNVRHPVGSPHLPHLFHSHTILS